MCDEELFLLIFIIEKASNIFSNRGIVVRQPSILTTFAQVVLLFFITISTVVVNNKYYCFYKIKKIKSSVSIFLVHHTKGREMSPTCHDTGNTGHKECM